MTAPVAIDARAAVRRETGGVERVARELATRLPALCPERYRVLAPRPRLAHRAGHGWEQLVLPWLARGSRLLLCPANFAPLAGRRNVLLVHDLAPLREPRWYGRAYGAWHRAALPVLAGRARLLLTPSEFVRGELIDRLGLAPDAVVACPLGVDARFEPSDARALRERLGLARPYVLALGTATERKNLGLLDRLAPTLAAAGLDAVIAGGERGYMPAPAPGAARRLGYVAEADLPALLSGAAALAIPSLYEGFGLPCLEAMACGTPVVASDRGALPETCGGAALIADPRDEAAFAAALTAAARDEELRSRLIARGRERAAAHDWERTAAAVDGALSAILDQAPGTRNQARSTS